MAQVIPYHTTGNPSRTFFELLGVLIPPYKAIVDSVNLQDTLEKYTANNPRLAQEEFDYAITTRQITIPIFSENSTTVTTTAADMATLPTMTQQDQQFTQINKDNFKYLQQQQQYQQLQTKSLPAAQKSLLLNQHKPNEASEQLQQQHISNNNNKQQSTQGEQDIQDAWQCVELDENDEDITAMLKIRQKVMDIKREFDGIKAAGQAASSSSSIVAAAGSRNGSIDAAIPPPLSGDFPGVVASLQAPNYLLTNEEDTNIPENYYFAQQQYQDGQLYYHSRSVPAAQEHMSNRGYEQQFNYENDRLNYLKSSNNSNHLYNNQHDERFTGTTTSEGEYQQADLQYQQMDNHLDEYNQQQHNQIEFPNAYNTHNGQMIRIEGQTPINYSDNENDNQLSAQQYELQQQLQQQLQQLSMIREEEEQESTLEMHYFSGSGKYNPSRGSQMSSVQSNNTNSNNDNNNSNNTNTNNGNYNNGSTYGDNRAIAIQADGTIDLPSEGSFEGQQQQQQQPINRKNHDILAKIAELDKKVKTALLKSEHK